MSLKHLIAGIMVGGFALILGVDPVSVAPEAASPGFVQADRVIAAQQKPVEHSAVDCDHDKVRVADCGKEVERADKPAAIEKSWMDRLVFPAGNKF